MEPLVTAEQVNAVLPGGASVTQGQIDALSTGIRNECGWHIAPSITETITLDSEGGNLLRLPSMHVTAVSELVSRDDYTYDILNGEVEWSKAGLIRLRPRRFLAGASWSSPFRSDAEFPVGYQAVTVTLTHGFELCPDDLIRYIAQAARQRILSETLVGRSVTFSPLDDIFTQSATLDKYRVSQGL